MVTTVINMDDVEVAQVSNRYTSSRKTTKFSMDEFIEELRENNSCDRAQACFRALNAGKVRIHAKALDLFLNSELPLLSTGRLFTAWAMTT